SVRRRVRSVTSIRIRRVPANDEAIPCAICRRNVGDRSQRRESTGPHLETGRRTEPALEKLASGEAGAKTGGRTLHAAVPDHTSRTSERLDRVIFEARLITAPAAPLVLAVGVAVDGAHLDLVNVGGLRDVLVPVANEPCQNLLVGQRPPSEWHHDVVLTRRDSVLLELMDSMHAERA